MAQCALSTALSSPAAILRHLLSTKVIHLTLLSKLIYSKAPHHRENQRHHWTSHCPCIVRLCKLKAFSFKHLGFSQLDLRSFIERLGDRGPRQAVRKDSHCFILAGVEVLPGLYMRFCVAVGIAYWLLRKIGLFCISCCVSTNGSVTQRADDVCDVGASRGALHIFFVLQWQGSRGE